MPAYIALPNGEYIRKQFKTGASARRYARHKVPPPWGIQHLDKDPWPSPWGDLTALKRHSSKAFNNGGA